MVILRKQQLDDMMEVDTLLYLSCLKYRDALGGGCDECGQDFWPTLRGNDAAYLAPSLGIIYHLSAIDIRLAMGIRSLHSASYFLCLCVILP